MNIILPKFSAFQTISIHIGVRYPGMAWLGWLSRGCFIIRKEWLLASYIADINIIVELPSCIDTAIINTKIPTFGIKMSDRNTVVRIKYPDTNIPVPMLMCVLKENVTRASTASTILEM